MDEMRFKS